MKNKNNYNKIKNARVDKFFKKFWIILKLFILILNITQFFKIFLRIKNHKLILKI